MAIKDKFAASLSSRTGLPLDKAALALGETIALIKTKVPAHIAESLDMLMNSANGADPSAWNPAVAPSQSPSEAPALEVPAVVPAIQPEAEATPEVVPAEGGQGAAPEAPAAEVVAPEAPATSEGSEDTPPTIVEGADAQPAKGGLLGKIKDTFGAKK